ncbi:hypothetical protein [Granulosicoccus antarcticus]|uniref:Uncharacterized protein n=1 Tax=Granulosicoccus antarcticus IMCC3135 TaxID=1192854 RepID=A0A2Z2NV55_9GAMM|nr:hypothetical protein [Granulosicoccus antarcticus]ASJ75356.1 hypothetical protein IMCC3135_26505 [Granulosicoccus antarcticus IMCC3135]
MTHRQYLTLAVLVALMMAIAIGLGQWSANLNPDGIIPHTPIAEVAPSAESNEAADVVESVPAEARSAFTFGASMGLLATGMLYCMLAAVLLLKAKSRGFPASKFIYSVAGLAVAGFALSYLIDDYFY